MPSFSGKQGCKRDRCRHHSHSTQQEITREFTTHSQEITGLAQPQMKANHSPSHNITTLLLALAVIYPATLPHFFTVPKHSKESFLLHGPNMSERKMSWQNLQMARQSDAPRFVKLWIMNCLIILICIKIGVMLHHGKSELWKRRDVQERAEIHEPTSHS